MLTSRRRQIVATLGTFLVTVVLLTSYRSGPTMRRIYAFKSQEDEIRLKQNPTAPPIRKIRINWKDLLSFIPGGASMKNCDKMMPNLPKQFGWDYVYQNKLFNRTLTEILKAHPLKNNPQPPEVFTRLLLKFAKEKWLQVVCDVDFIFGYEQLLFSMTRMFFTMHTFTDIRDMWPIKGPMLAYVSYKLRRNVHLIKDKSKGTVTEFLKSYPHCELMLMGQYHVKQRMEEDINTLSLLANPGGHVVIWELTEHSTEVWQDAMKRKLVKEEYSCTYGGKKDGRGIAIGYFIMQTNQEKQSKHTKPESSIAAKKTLQVKPPSKAKNGKRGKDMGKGKVQDANKPDKPLQKEKKNKLDQRIQPGGHMNDEHHVAPIQNQAESKTLETSKPAAKMSSKGSKSDQNKA